MRRLVAASESLVIGFGGTSVVSRETGVSRRAIIQGIKELEQEPSETPTRVRRAGGGRKKTVDQDTTLQRDLELLVEPVTRGDPESPRRLKSAPRRLFFHYQIWNVFSDGTRRTGLWYLGIKDCKLLLEVLSLTASNYHGTPSAWQLATAHRLPMQHRCLDFYRTAENWNW